MKVKQLHPWEVTTAEARQIQIDLRRRLVRTDRIGRIRRVAGADVAFDLRRGRAIAGVIVFTFPELIEVERVSAVQRECGEQRGRFAEAEQAGHIGAARRSPQIRSSSEKT